MHSTLVATTSGSASSFLMNELGMCFSRRKNSRQYSRRSTYLLSSCIRKEDAEPEVVATRVECIGVFQAFHQSSKNFKGSEDKQVEKYYIYNTAKS